eukprot:CAMPEP_0184863276 /NCGR_PEP_ID=MMETSP0580-20130426/10408_1 /TAXON_ID=1118495 /ORGANISM="Dactyliosolen fragilissimus" /LENGTH=266 /DNA_ID=CAMNT_0027361527 /DNA_START=77 /DNA_END=873 /DNA_ORIENTATION=-
MTFIGRKDLPQASRFLGSQLGRIVGFLQGARAKADTFAANNELRELQNELRSGLRDLDAVRAELAVAASSRGLVGKQLGRFHKNNNLKNTTNPKSDIPIPSQTANGKLNAAATNTQSLLLSTHLKEDASIQREPLSTTYEVTGDKYLSAARKASDDENFSYEPTSMESLAPREQSVRAVAEEEWEKQGIAFRSRAEKGTGAWESSPNDFSSGGGGSFILSDLMQQSLIYDQYDRTIQEQDEALHRKVQQVKTRKNDAQSDNYTVNG